MVFFLVINKFVCLVLWRERVSSAIGQCSLNFGNPEIRQQTRNKQTNNEVQVPLEIVNTFVFNMINIFTCFTIYVL